MGMILTALGGLKLLILLQTAIQLLFIADLKHKSIREDKPDVKPGTEFFPTK